MTTLDESFDRTLGAARRGRDRAWDELYADLAPVVLGYLRGRGFPDAEDVLGETFLEVVRDLHRFEGDERGFRSWVLTIAHHRGLDAARKRARRPSDAAEGAVLEAAAPPVTDAETEALALVATDETVAALGALGGAQREVLLLRLLGGLTATEIAEVTGRSREAVKALQKRAIVQLREAAAEPPWSSGERTPATVAAHGHTA
jgi:RNA polymerase sigma factor (sigma-70 family)